ncbi:fungal-specific transcription factor domain-containing protein [Paraphoma chrysanthemicola]|uniref:Fungal-specific transcription factor domain-containing protein n=1 Tax=Paraphoma chrysanthemicola TaxID=798071 RepID=A0A8K0RF58_9PLEO|nr:fungal-specific transcription factor domain-containing protein [Paraphoma chrysanthemicola]
MEAQNRRRSTSGCLTCRMRRKKCDEEKPTCIGCRRNRLICNWSKSHVSETVVALSRLPDHKRPSPFEAMGEVSFETKPPETGKLQCALMSPIASIPGLTRPRDALLFSHYLQVTAAQLAGKTEPKNPFLSHLVPIACNEPSVLRCMLAVSGAQLSVQSAEYEGEARSNYAVSLRSVKHNLVNWRESQTSVIVSLLTSTIMLGFFEVVIGDTHANFQFHLRASRTLLYELRKKRAHEVDKSLLDLLTELYAFFAITTNITLHAELTPDRTIPQDSLLSFEVLLFLNQGSEFYGILFGAAHELFALINPITNTARHFLADINLEARFEQIVKYETRIQGWAYTAKIPSGVRF